MELQTRRWRRIVVGVVVVVVGFFCLNYTNGFGIEHHAEWAREHGVPPPAYPIFLAGVILMPLGGAIIGRFMSRAPRDS
jgi:hypothetical protein